MINRKTYSSNPRTFGTPAGADFNRTPGPALPSTFREIEARHRQQRLLAEAQVGRQRKAARRAARAAISTRYVDGVRATDGPPVTPIVRAMRAVLGPLRRMPGQVVLTEPLVLEADGRPTIHLSPVETTTTGDEIVAALIVAPPERAVAPRSMPNQERIAVPTPRTSIARPRTPKLPTSTTPAPGTPAWRTPAPNAPAAGLSRRSFRGLVTRWTTWLPFAPTSPSSPEAPNSNESGNSAPTPPREMQPHC